MPNRTIVRNLGLAVLVGAAASAYAAAGSADAVRGSAFEQLGLESGASAPAIPGTSAPQAYQDAASPRAAGIGPELDPRFLEFGDAIGNEARADWNKRLKENGGSPSFAPLGPIDPAKDLLLCVPGHGQNFQDMHEVAKLKDTYQIVIAVVNDDKSMEENGRGLADIIGSLTNNATGRELRIVAHSMGGGISQLMLQELVDRKKLYDGSGSIFSKVIFVPMDSIWRGVDVPKALGQVPAGLSQYFGKYGSIVSLMNEGPVMGRMQRVSMPANVTTHFVTTHHKPATSPELRHFEPIANWYSNELGAGELDKLWDFLRKGETDLSKLDSFSNVGFVRKRGLQYLWRTLARDADYQAHAAEFRDAARAGTKEEFAARYDAALEKVVDTFNVPEHAGFMWKDPAFLPRLRERLKD